jgi:hypothetical protein
VSPTSTEGRYWRGIVTALALLAIACGSLFAVNAAQGPKLGSVQLDLNRPLAQQLRLVANQPVAEISESQVRIMPATPFTVSTSGNVIAITFSSALDYSTEYGVTVSGVRSPVRDVESSFATSFSTVDTTVYYLDRAGDTDRILATGIARAEPQVVYEAETITEFARVGRVLAVVTRDANRIDSLNLVQLGTTGVETVPLPDDGWVTEVHASDTAQTLGFVLSSVGDNDYSRTLFTVDLAAGRELRPAVDLRGDPLHVRDWQFRPATETIVALDSSGALAVLDPSTPGSVLPLGDYLTLSHISTDGSTLTVSDQLGFSTLVIADLDAERLAAAPIDGVEPYLGEAQVLTTGILEHVYSYYADENRFDSYLVLQAGAEQTTLFGSRGGAVSILHFSVSPNEQYVAVEVDPGRAGASDDGYIGSSRPTDVTTYVIELATGDTVATFSGFDLAW